MERNVLVVGKFLPFHSGHQALIEQATRLGTHVDVILVANENDPYPAMQRALSIYESFSHVDLRVHVVDNIMDDEDTPKSNKAWADYTKAILGYYPDLVVASEHYANGWAKAMGSKWFIYDQARTEFPVSGTLCRKNSYIMKDFVPSSTARWFFPRIVVLGAESTGTTTLATALGEYYNTSVVPEYGRVLGEALVTEGGILDSDAQDAAWDDAKFMLTSRGQDAIEERMARDANGVLICDTDSLATYIWYEYAMKKKPVSSVSGDYEMTGKLWDAGWAMSKKHSLYIVTGDDIPFTQDPLGTRTGEDLRKWMTDRFMDVMGVLGVAGIPSIQVSGPHEQRLRSAIEAIDKVLDKSLALV